MNILISGGSGFIGTNFIDYLINDREINKNVSILNLDKQTYAGQGKNIEHIGINKNSKYNFIQGDICDKYLVEEIFRKISPDIVFNFAAESHVDRSIENSNPFISTNVLGTSNLLDYAKKYGLEKFIQISTDEVYGSANEKSFSETDALNPSSPYSASKASADLIALSYFKTHNLPVIVTRSANNYGPYQFPEKLLPLFITNLIQGKKVPLMWSNENPGLNIRDWLNVRDNCRAIWFVSQSGKNGEIYNISGENEKTNFEMTKKVLDYFKFGEEMIEKVAHRKGHDFKYSIDNKKLKQLEFKYKHTDLDSEIKNLCRWYQQNESWWRPLKK